MRYTLPRFLFAVSLLAAVSLFSQTQTTTAAGQWLAPACKPKLFGLADAQGKTILAAKYDFLVEQEPNAWIALYAGNYGVVNSKGEWLIQPKFFGIEQFKKGKAIAAKRMPRSKPRNEYGSYDYEYYSRDSVIRYGVVDESGVWVIDAAYDYLELSDDGTVLYTDENGLYGFLNPDGSVLVRAQYPFATPMSGGAAVIGEHNPNSVTMDRYSLADNQFTSGNYFVIDVTGKKMHEQPYDLIRPFSEGRAAFNKGGLWKRDKYHSGDQKLVGGKWGFLDASGNPVIGAQYDYVYDFERGKAKVRLGERTFWVDKDGKETTPPVMDAVTAAIDVFCEPGSFGYINLKGEWVIQPQFYAAHEFSEGLAAAMVLRASDMDCETPELSSGYYDDDSYSYRRGDLFRLGTRRRYSDEEEEKRESRPLRRLFGYIDATGNMLLPAKYEVALPFHEGRAYVCFRGQWGVIDRQGDWIMPPVLDWLDRMSQQEAYFNDYYMSEYSFSNKDYNNRMERDRTYDHPPETDLYIFKEGMGAVSFDGKFGFIDSTGKIIIAPVYDEVAAFSQGLAAVRHSGKWGYVDKTGREVIPVRFRYANSFTDNGLAAVGSSLKESELPAPDADMEYETDGDTYYGYIDRTGKWAIKPQFSYADDFSEGLAVASVDYGAKGFIDKTGKFIIPPKYDYANRFVNGYACVHVRMYESVYIDKNGKVSKTYNSENRPAEKNYPLVLHVDAVGRYGFTNEKGVEVIPHVYRTAGNFVLVK